MITTIQSPPLTIPAGDVQPMNVPTIAIPFSLLLAQQMPLVQARSDAASLIDVQHAVQPENVPIIEPILAQSTEQFDAWTMMAAMPVLPQMVYVHNDAQSSDRQVSDVEGVTVPLAAMVPVLDGALPEETPLMTTAPIPQAMEQLPVRAQEAGTPMDVAVGQHVVARDEAVLVPVERMPVERLAVERMSVEWQVVDLKKHALEAMRTTDQDGLTIGPLVDPSARKTEVVRAMLNELGGGTIAFAQRTLPNAHTMLGALHFGAPIAHMVVAEEEPTSEQLPIVVPGRVETPPMVLPVKTEHVPITGWASFDDVLRTQLNNPQIATQAVIRLSPEHLGNVEVQLSMQQGALQATFVTESVHAKEALEGQLSSLRQQLTLHGVTVERMIVADNSAYTMQSQQQSDQRHSRHKNHNEERTHAEIEVANEWDASLRASVQQWRNGSFSTIA
jgi:hypothetical protein